MKKGTRLKSRAEAIKAKGGDPSKKVEKAKAFLSSAKMAKSMTMTYNRLNKYEGKKINRQYTRILRRNGFRNFAFGASGAIAGTVAYGTGNGRTIANNHLKSELLARSKYL